MNSIIDLLLVIVGTCLVLVTGCALLMAWDQVRLWFGRRSTHMANRRRVDDWWKIRWRR
jgi:hypothetical protein